MTNEEMRAKAKELDKYFMVKTREGGEEFTCFVDDIDYNTPFVEMVRELHDGALPNDWSFSKIVQILTAIEYYEGDTYEIAEDIVDIYTQDLLEWAGLYQSRVDEYMSENEGPHHLLSALLSAAQYQHVSEMTERILTFIGAEE